MTESEKMRAGLWYDANFDKELLEQRLAAEELCYELNQTRPKDAAKREEILKETLNVIHDNRNFKGIRYITPFSNKVY